MDFRIEEEHRLLKETVDRFVDDYLIPLEPAVLARETRGEGAHLTAEELAPLHDACRELGLWGLDVPEAVGGAELPALAMTYVNEAVGRTVTPFTFPPDSPNLHMLLTTANEAQKRKYLEPYARGEIVSAIGISEPGAGADPAHMATRAVRDGDDWIINGRKIWVSRVPESAFTILMAVTDPEKGSRGGITAFIVEKDTPGFIIEREIAMIGGARTYELVLEDMRIPDAQRLGNEGEGFAPMQLRLTVRRLQMGAWCIGMAERALQVLCRHADTRVTFGERLADRQSIQWWVADAATRIHALRLMVQEAAWKQDLGVDVRTEASMVKVFGTELASDVIDQGMQALGAFGMTKETPLQLMAREVRTMRIYEGPSEVHRWVVARRTIPKYLSS
ncbi:MAG: acyl-CoA dehydrogenase [Gammaproteobacteria bacterium]|nr:acyl-CoA dehydrogenase [Gammaproteobacteria bacterium]MCY4277687.1 acyl-CoA dehydrogenase [Gammaproteobacteria bacterium]